MKHVYCGSQVQQMMFMSIPSVSSAFSYFSLFGLDLCFTLSEEILESHYALAQKHFHPDQQTHNRPLAQASHQTMAKIHEAYAHLKDPVKRAEHLLVLHHAWPIDPQRHASVFETVFQMHEACLSDASKRAHTFRVAYEEFAQAFQNKAWVEAQAAYITMKAASPVSLRL